MPFGCLKFSLVLICIALACAALPAQERGGKPISAQSAKKQKPSVNATRALVIGISSYQDPAIPDLRFAHRDAGEMVTFLKSGAGGKLLDDNILLLSNERATVAKIYSALDWLLEESQPDDKVIIYFSGHGDVETKTLRQRGFLLAYDTPPTNYRIGALRLEDLNDYISTLSIENEAKVVIFTDACRSGHLAGGADGVMTTAENLSDSLGMEVKIMSCKPDELSLEGEQWGGGRGVFSYHLLDGLMGLADLNDDNVVVLSEIDQYLRARVPEETEHKQLPNTRGSPQVPLFAVDEQIARTLRKRKQEEDLPLALLASRGSKASAPTQPDSVGRRLYEEFLAALDRKYFLPIDQSPSNKPGRSASELYDSLLRYETLEPLFFSMKQTFVVALQDQAQAAINAYLAADPEELEERWLNYGGRYKKNPAYLEKAASLLGESHILFRQLLAKKQYFEGVILRLDGSKNQADSLFDRARESIESALHYDSTAAYLHNELGLIFDEIRLSALRSGNTESASNLHREQLRMYQNARQIAPKWAMPFNNLAATYREMRQLERAEEMANEAIRLRPDLPSAYFNLALIHRISGNTAEAIHQLKNAVAVRPNYVSAYAHLGSTYFKQNQLDSAVQCFQKAISYDSAYVNAYYDLGVVYLIQKKYDLAEKVYLKIIQLNPGNYEAYYNLACIKSIQSDIGTALDWLGQAVRHGLKDENLIQSDPDLENLRKNLDLDDLFDKNAPEKKD